MFSGDARMLLGSFTVDFRPVGVFSWTLIGSRSDDFSSNMLLILRVRFLIRLELTLSKIGSFSSPTDS